MSPDERRRVEASLLAKKYAKIRHGPNVEWVVVHSVPLPPGWNRDKTDILLVVPPGYPSTPPDNFYVNNGLRLANGGMPSNYNDNSYNHDGVAWGTFSHHLDGGWKPVMDPTHGSTLLTYLLGCEQRLREIN